MEDRRERPGSATDPRETLGGSAPPRERRPAKRAARRFLVHPVTVVRRLLAEHATPRSLAMATAFGVIVGVLPPLGFHTVFVIVGARWLRVNLLMALGANQVCVIPVFPMLCIEAGYFMRHGVFLTEVSMRTLWNEALLRLWEWMLGACVVGPLLALFFGGLIWGLASILQRRTPPLDEKRA